MKQIGQRIKRMKWMEWADRSATPVRSGALSPQGRGELRIRNTFVVVKIYQQIKQMGQRSFDSIEIKRMQRMEGW